jgi:ribosomal protein L2
MVPALARIFRNVDDYVRPKHPNLVSRASLNVLDGNRLALIASIPENHLHGVANLRTSPSEPTISRGVRRTTRGLYDALQGTSLQEVHCLEISLARTFAADVLEASCSSGATLMSCLGALPAVLGRAGYWRRLFYAGVSAGQRSSGTDIRSITGVDETIQRALSVDPTRPRIRRRKPTTPSNRATALIDYSVLYRGRPVKRLTSGLRRSTGGRNNQGRTTIWHRGGGHRRLYRLIDFRRQIYAGLPGYVERIEYDPNRSSLIALLRYTLPDREKPKGTTVVSDLYGGLADVLRSTPALASLLEPRLVYLAQVTRNVELAPDLPLADASGDAFEASPQRFNLATDERRSRPQQKHILPEAKTSNVRVLKRSAASSPKTHLSYIICPQGIRIGDLLLSSTDGPVEPKPGNACPLRYLPIGTQVHNIEMRPRSGGKLCRAAGTSAQLLEKDEKRKLALLRLQSREVRYVHLDCMATVGAVSNPEHQNQSYGKAGRMRWRGWRPVTRGVAMNPVDHPHGGGEGKTSGGRPSVTPWGKPTKGYRTVRKPRGAKFIVRRRFE